MVDQMTPPGQPARPGESIAPAAVEHRRIRYERSDVAFLPVLVVILAAGGIVALTLFVVLQLYWAQNRAFDRREAALDELSVSDATPLPLGPRLEQIDRMAGIETSNVFRQEASFERQLNAYGETQDEGFVRIPIQQAMTFSVGRLPARDSPDLGNDNGLIDFGEPNSGRLPRGSAP